MLKLTMMPSVYVYDPTVSDEKSRVRGVGRYLQILKENFKNDFQFISEISNFKFQISNSVFINPFFNFLQPPLVMKRIAKKQIAVIHDLIPLKYPDHFPAGIRGNINIYLNKLALNNYDSIVTDSEASKKDIIKILGIEEDKVKVIYPCLPRIFTNPKSEILNSKQFPNFQNLNLEFVSSFDIRASNFCLYVGDATWNKNLVNLARAIKIINVPCVFVGKVFAGDGKGWDPDSAHRFFQPAAGREHWREGIFRQDPQINHPWQQEFRQFLKETKNDKRFIFQGFVEDYKLFKLYQQAKVNVLISRDEGFGFSYLEAANFSCPSVLSDIPVLREISNKLGVVYANPNSPNDIADKIGELYFNHDLRNKLGFEALERSKFFSQDNFKKEFLSYLK